MNKPFGAEYLDPMANVSGGVKIRYFLTSGGILLGGTPETILMEW